VEKQFVWEGKSRRRRNVKRCKASYTVEAAVIVPLAIAVMALAMRIGILLCQEVKAEKEAEALTQMWEVGEFYRYQAVGEVTD
jgi:hypothetical protein